MAIYNALPNGIFQLLPLIFALSVQSNYSPFKGSPIVLVPGDGGTQLWAKLNKTTSVHWLCEKHTATYYPLWLNLESLIRPFAIDCFVDNMRLVYDNITHLTSNSPGVDIQIQDWGNTTTVEWLDPSQVSLSHYFATIVQNAVNWGYRRGKDIRGAPFDFRKAPNEMSEFYKNFTDLIQDTYYQNGNRKVVLIGHSLGNPVILYFLNNQTQLWKDKFLKAYISISAPWGGAAKVLKMFASGYNLGHWSYLLPPLTFRLLERSMPSSSFLMPSDKFWFSNETLVLTADRNYTVNDYQRFFDDLGYTDGWSMYQATRDLVYDLKHPGVETHCLYSNGIDTPEQFVYKKGYFPDYQPTMILYGEGDGTVNLRSLKGCLRWKDEQKQAFYSKLFPNQEHLLILKDLDLVAYIRQVAFK